ncbi:Ig-like domain-containing protein [Photobacterium sp. ZSDE20]|uniref:Ig-like domain-containing protein n=1 Tax=Photobacterium pectinilyticum TaxID=2906793 RepID=A0ABT1N5V2_9GAMM|nr:Ig-like domain-containing protein [Photobacterium sp. ZSDE20]MCQ1060120.1 Ig-like domain-containing protein [Photobacterium sp. ZSDE20]MDD1827576.1 Ig-like domain-containing protein [Photobacterium sp. ZSDE20]
MTRVKPLVLALSSLLVSAGLNASVIEYSFVNPDGQEQYRTSSDLQYINASSGLTVMMSGGLDRLLSLSIRHKENGTVAFEQTSDRIRVEDRITDSIGRNYYGKIMDVGSIPNGSYIVRSQMLSMAGEILETETKELVVDTVKPRTGNFSWSMPYGGGYAPDGTPIFASASSRLIRLDGVSDSNSGVKDVTFETRLVSGGQVVRSGSVNFIKELGYAQLGDGAQNSGAAVAIPSGVQDLYEFVFHIEDRAGNVTSASQIAYVNSDCGQKPEMIGYEEPGHSGSFMGQPGFKAVPDGSYVLNKNPLDTIFKISREEFRALPEGAIFGGEIAGMNANKVTVLSTDSDNVYFKVHALQINQNGNSDWNAKGWVNKSTYLCHPMSAASGFSFSNAAKPPVTTAMNWHIDGLGWVTHNYGHPTSNPNTAPANTRISQIKFTGEPREYAQKASMYGQTCTVPVGGTTCTLNVNLEYNTSGKATHYHDRYGLYRDGVPELQDRISYVIEYDNAPPYFTGLVNHDQAKRSVVFNVEKPFAGNSWNRVRLEKAGLLLKSNGQTVRTIDGERVTDATSSVITATYSSHDKEGDYRLYAYGEDLHKNRFEHFLFEVTLDFTPPEIHLSVNDEPFLPGMEVRGLESFAIKLIDQSETRIEQIVLKGGPADDEVNLSWRSLGNNTYALEYPVIFPSLTPDEIYTLTITASDKFGQADTDSFSFTYLPNNLVELKSTPMLPVDAELLDRSDNPLVYIKSNELRTSNGNLASGIQDLIFTLRADAELPIVVAGEKVNIGETKSIGVSIDGNDGVLRVPVYPANHQDTGQANFMFEIREIK